MIMTLGLTDDETRALAAHLKHALEYDRFPYAPRLEPLKAILAKLASPVLPCEPLPPLKAGAAPRRPVAAECHPKPGCRFRL
jgi:hypothetical protein